MAFETLPEGAKLIQNKTEGYIIIDISNVDVGLWWQKTGGNPLEKLKATLIKADGTAVAKLGDDDEVMLVNTAPQKVKVLIVPGDITIVGALKIFVEFKIEDGWLPAETVSLTVEDDPTTI